MRAAPEPTTATPTVLGVDLALRRGRGLDHQNCARTKKYDRRCRIPTADGRIRPQWPARQPRHDRPRSCLMSFTSWSRPFWTRREVSDTEVLIGVASWLLGRLATDLRPRNAATELLQPLRGWPGPGGTAQRGVVDAMSGSGWLTPSEWSPPARSGRCQESSIFSDSLRFVFSVNDEITGVEVHAMGSAALHGRTQAD